MVDALTRWPSLSSSPWIRWYPQPLFSVASCPMGAAISALTGDRPVRWGQIHSFFRNRSPDQMLATAAPWTSPWLPPGYEQNFWNAA